MSERHETQYNVLKFIAGYLSTHGYAPTVREIGAGVGLTAPSTVHGHLARLERKGFLNRKANQSRSWEITASGYHFLAPIADTELELNIADDTNSTFPPDFGTNPEQFIFVQPNDSLINEHILAGDQLLISATTDAPANALKAYQDSNGTLLIDRALVGETFTLVGIVTAIYRQI